MENANSTDSKVIAGATASTARIDDDHPQGHDDRDVYGKDVVVEDEETKIENFFSLIRCYREARNRLMIVTRSKLEIDHDRDHRDQYDVDEVLFEVKKRKEVKRMKAAREDDQGESRGGGWVPSFERGDFTDESLEFIRTPASAAAAPPMFVRVINNPCCNNNNASTANKDNNGLDLNLTL